MEDFNTNLGMVPAADGSIELEAGPAHLVAPETVHFAVLTTLCEVAAARAVGVPVVPATVSVSLMARARPGLLVGRGKVLRRGRRLAFAEGEVLQDGELVARASVTFAVL